MPDQVKAVIATIKRDIPDLATQELGSEFFYPSLPLCVIDAVYSIQMQYSQCQEVVARWCQAQTPAWTLGPRPCRGERTVSEFLEITGGRSPLDLATNVYVHKGRTSSTSGILKAEAIQRYCLALRNAKIDRIRDMQNTSRVSAAWEEIRQIPGQSSGVAFGYFAMLAGDEDRIKPDTRLRNFVTRALGETARVSAALTQDLILAAYQQLKPKMPGLTPRLLDHAIWRHETGPGV